MLDPKLIRQNIKLVAAELKKRGMTVDIKRIDSLEEQRKSLQTKVQDLQNARNSNAKHVGIAKAKGENIEALLSEINHVNHSLKTAEEELNIIQIELNDLLARLPNIPHSTVPIGKSDADNQVIRIVGTPPVFNFKPKDHVDLGIKLGMDFETAAKLSGARFVVLKGALARLQRALIQFMLDLHTKEHGYEEISVPYLVHEDILYGTGQLPKLKDDLFAVTSNDHGYYLIPTAEVPVTNTVRDQILEPHQLPIKYVCYSSCFRSEAGSYGKDTRGMIRHHQFEKVELVQIVHPDQSYAALENLTQHAETVLQRLELPYRVVALCTADLGFQAAKTYDLEVWLPAQGQYREISSCSNTESFQARRMKARFRDTKTNKPEFIHTLNGSGLAIGRTMVAILENFQDEQGNIHIPTALQPYLDNQQVIKQEKSEKK